MMPRRDPLADPAPLIRRVYSYVAYRIGNGPDAEDVTSEVFERALKYRDSFEESRGAPLPWLLGIARRCVNDALAHSHSRSAAGHDGLDTISAEDIEEETLQRIMLGEAIASLDERSRDLLALRYGADLRAREIGQLVGLKTNAVEVALHRALEKLRADLDGRGAERDLHLGEPASKTAS